MIEIGTTFGDLTVRGLRRGAKNVHPVALCVCRCGNIRNVRQSTLRRGLVMACAPCALRAGWRRRPRNSEAVRWLLEAESTYRSNAKRKRVNWALDRDQFRCLVDGACHYCGMHRAGGIDRLSSRDGYASPNVVPCCAPCNYAKREMTEPEFLELVARIYNYRCAT